MHFSASHVTNDYRVREDIPGACLDERANKLRTFQDLGPQDLVSLTKSIPGGKSTEVSSMIRY